MDKKIFGVFAVLAMLLFTFEAAGWRYIMAGGAGWEPHAMDIIFAWFPIMFEAFCFVKVSDSKSVTTGFIFLAAAGTLLLVELYLGFVGFFAYMQVGHPVEVVGLSVDLTPIPWGAFLIILWLLLTLMSRMVIIGVGFDQKRIPAFA